MNQLIEAMKQTVLETDGIVLSCDIAQVDKLFPQYRMHAGGGYTRTVRKEEFVTINPLICKDSISATRVMFHELGHATGHSKRLARPFTVDENKSMFIDYEYWVRASAIEEVTAELTAVKCLRYLSINDATSEAESAKYIGKWSDSYDLSIRDMETAEKDAIAGFRYIRDNWIKVSQLKINNSKKVV